VEMKDLCDEVGFVYYLIIARLYDLDPKLNKNERTYALLCLLLLNTDISQIAHSIFVCPTVYLNRAYCKSRKSPQITAN